MPTDGVALGLQNATLWVLEARSLASPPEALGQDGSLPVPAAGTASMLGLRPHQASLQGQHRILRRPCSLSTPPPLCLPHARTLVNAHRVTQISRRLTRLRTLDLNTFAIEGHRIQGLGVDALEATIPPLPAGGNGHPLQYSCLENPRTEEPGGLWPIGSQRVRHN